MNDPFLQRTARVVSSTGSQAVGWVGIVFKLCKLFGYIYLDPRQYRCFFELNKAITVNCSMYTVSTLSIIKALLPRSRKQ